MPDVRKSPAPVNGFTLTELVVIIALVGVLSAFLLSAVAQVRAMANAGRCASNLAQCALAHVTYANDNLGELPHTSRLLGGSTQIPWSLQVKDYFATKAFTGNGSEIDISQVAQCQVYRRDAWPVIPYDGSQAWKHWGYVRNNYLYQNGESAMIEQRTLGPNSGYKMGDWRSSSWCEPFRLARITHPSRRFLVGDGSNTQHSVTLRSSTQSITYSPTAQDTSYGLIGYQYAYLFAANNIVGSPGIEKAMTQDAHKGKRTYAMVDGSARRLEDSALNPANQFFLSIVDPGRY